MSKFIRIIALVLLLSMVLMFATACDISSIIDKITGADTDDDGDGSGDDGTGGGENDGSEDVTKTTAELTALYVNGQLIKGFKSTVFDYTYSFDVAYGYGKVTYKKASNLAKVDEKVENGKVEIKVTSGDGMTTNTYTITFVPGELDTSKNTIVNKDGVDAIVSYVIDDGIETTADYAMDFMWKYDYLNLSFAIQGNKFATLETERGTDGLLHYSMDGNKYTFSQNATQKTYTSFWQDIVERATNHGNKVEIIGHSYNHAAWGNNDDGGTQSVLQGNGQTYHTAEHAVGSSSAQIYGTQQILKNYFGTYFAYQTTLPYIIAGTGMYSNKTDPESYMYYFYNEIMKSGVEDDTIISARNCFEVKDDSKHRLPNYVVTPEKYADKLYRIDTPGYMINRSNGGADPDDTYLWTAYIDEAIKMNGWASFCIHYIVEDGSAYTKHDISVSQADELFGYTKDKNVWIATYTEASQYYAEWSTATLDTKYDASKDEISVSITDKEDDAVFNMALTAKIYIPGTWDTAFASSEELTIHTDDSGAKFVYVNVVPDAPAATVITATAK